MDAEAAGLWRSLREALSAAGEDVVQLPEKRTDAVDWVRDGVHMPWEDILAARGQWERYMEEAPIYPSAMFAGKGIVILGGGLTYMVPAWVNVHMLRRTGCQLPVEMWFPAVEYPTPPLIAALAQLGVVSRKLPDIGKVAGRSGQRRLDARRPPAGSQDMTGFTLKIAALLLSQFQEVLFLDSDNVASGGSRGPLRVRKSTWLPAALLWPDYWDSTAAPTSATSSSCRRFPKSTFGERADGLRQAADVEGLVLAAFLQHASKLVLRAVSPASWARGTRSLSRTPQCGTAAYHLIGTPRRERGTGGSALLPSQRSCWHEFCGATA
eukprot:jgi/Botrbrau1/7802/Bobra.0159s0230.1